MNDQNKNQGPNTGTGSDRSGQPKRDHQQQQGQQEQGQQGERPQPGDDVGSDADRNKTDQQQQSGDRPRQPGEPYRGGKSSDNDSGDSNR